MVSDLSQEKRIRPSAETEADPREIISSLPLAADSEMIARADALVALVQDKRGRYRRRVFLTLASAERAVDHARARGVDAQVVLVQLVPIGGDVID